ncbi:unnamed protein product [Brachionus calyciflorus]|uniref:Uncharacterized protein n=1 Tax=Brachionus calyciflorus TaxID=104777 RepID=A0A814N3T4_9BILA|nr:unnamed protein product [Brachionus calyciflorus]
MFRKKNLNESDFEGLTPSDFITSTQHQNNNSTNSKETLNRSITKTKSNVTPSKSNECEKTKPITRSRRRQNLLNENEKEKTSQLIEENERNLEELEQLSESEF